MNSTGPEQWAIAPAVRARVLFGGGKTKFGKRIRNLLVMIAIAAVVFLPTAVYLGTLTAAAHVAPNYCNNAGGCPWTQ